MKSILTNHLEYILAAAVAAFGGSARMLSQHGRKLTFFGMLAELFVAGFAGVLINALLLEFNAGSELKVVIVAISGYASREVIALVKQIALSAIRAILKQNAPGENEEQDKSDKSELSDKSDRKEWENE